MSSTRRITTVKSGIGLSSVKSGLGLSSFFASNDASHYDTLSTEEGQANEGSVASAAATTTIVALVPPQDKIITSRFSRVLLAGAGFLADAYDLFVINLVLQLLKAEYPEYTASGRIHALQGSVASAALIGSIFGQLIAGSMADIVGRKRIFVATAALISVGSIGSAFVMDTPSLTIYGQLACWRFILGCGVGGEYPLAATVTSESSSAENRGKLMAGVFAMQGVGSLLSVVVVVLCLLLGCSNAFTWRFALAFGALPALIAFPWRLKMHETDSFQRIMQEREIRAGNATTSTAEIRNTSLSTSTNFTTAAASAAAAAVNTGGSGIELQSSQQPAPTSSAGTGGGVRVAAATDEQQYLLSTPSATTPTEAPISTSSNGGESSGYSAIHEIITVANSNSSLSYDNNNSSSSNSNYGVYATGGGGGGTVDYCDPDRPPLTYMEQLIDFFAIYKWHLLGTALNWFLLDLVFYANGLFNHEVMEMVLSSSSSSSTGSSTGTVDSNILRDAYGAGLICLVGVPGYILCVFFVETIGRKNIQMFGFLAMAMLFMLCNMTFDWSMANVVGASSKDSEETITGDASMYRKYVFLSLYALTFLFSNFGPNTTAFIIPGEIFPSDFRATFHGISAASGKLGAAFGAFFFPLIIGGTVSSGSTSTSGNGGGTEGMKLGMLMCALVALLGCVITYFFTPRYEASHLVRESFLPLEASCLKPTHTQLKRCHSKTFFATADLQLSCALPKRQQQQQQRHHAGGRRKGGGGGGGGEESGGMVHIIESSDNFKKYDMALDDDEQDIFATNTATLSASSQGHTNTNASLKQVQQQPQQSFTPATYEEQTLLNQMMETGQVPDALKRIRSESSDFYIGGLNSRDNSGWN